MRAREPGTSNRQLPARECEEGFLLLGAIVAIALVMIALSVAAVKVSFALRREREVESARRAQQYVRAIREYYLKFGRYPTSVDQLKNTNKIRFLRQEYVDPLTGKADYRLILVGQNKTQPTGFFGEPLSGLPGSGPGGTPAGNPANGIGGNSSAPSGSNGGGPNAGTSINSGNGTGANATTGFGGTSFGTGTQTNGPGSSAAQTGNAGQSNSPFGASAATSSPGGLGASSGPGPALGPIMGVGSSATGNAILAVNGQTSYETWEFLYDPRVERLRQAGQLNQGVTSANGSGNAAGLGSASQTGTPAGAGANGAGGNGAPTGAPAGGAQPTQP